MQQLKARKKKIPSTRPSSAGRTKRPRDPPPPPDGAAGTSGPKDGRFVRLHPGKDYSRPHPRESSDGGSAGQRGRQQSAAPSPSSSVGEAQCIGAGIVCFHPSLVWAMLPTQPAGSRHASQPLPPCGEPGKRGNSRARPDGDDEYSGRRGDHPPKPMGIIDSQATKEKKKKKKKSAGPITDLTFLPNFWCATDLSTLPELVGKSASGVYDALQNGKDLELRSTRETLCWPDGHLSSLRDLLPDSLFVYSEYDPSCNRDRRIVLQVGKGGTSPLGTNVYASRGAAVAAGGDRVCPPSLVAHLLDTGVAVGTPPLSEAWGTATYAKAGFGSGSCFLLEVAPVGLLMARTTDLRPSNKSPTKKKEPRQASRSPESVADLPPPKARRNLGLDPLSDPIANLEKELKAGADRPTAAAESPMGATAEVEADPYVTPVTMTNAAAQKSGGKVGIADVEGSIECARCGLEMTSDAELKKHLKNEHGLGVNDQELADMAFAPCPVPGCNTIHSLKGATVGVTPLYRHLQQYSNKVNLDGHEEHIKYMHSSDGGTSGDSCGRDPIQRTSIRQCYPQ